MKINISEFVTDVSDISSLNELIGKEIGNPCLLVVHGENLKAESADPELKAFFEDAPFLTALADDSHENTAAELFDMVIPAENTAEYTARLFRDKTVFQAKQIVSCFTAARKGSAEDVLECESRAFYRLMNAKNGGNGNE